MQRLPNKEFDITSSTHHRASRLLFCRSRRCVLERKYFQRQRSSQRGQTVVETAFVFGSIIFFSFTMMNFSAYLHTRFVATYAAFMAARSYQVYGDHTGAQAFKEAGRNGNETALLEEEKTLTVIRTAEDIFTCALPWVMPPQEDVDSQIDLTNLDEAERARAGCMEGERRYDKTNINKNITFYRFEEDAGSNSADNSRLDTLEKGFAEKGREPLRYGIMRLQYKNRLLINPYSIFDMQVEVEEEDGRKVKKVANDQERARVWHKVFVPALLNPGLEAGLEELKPEDDSNVDQSVPEAPQAAAGAGGAAR